MNLLHQAKLASYIISIFMYIIINEPVVIYTHG